MGTKKKRNVQIHNPVEPLSFDESEIVALFHFLDESASCQIPDGELSIACLNEKAHCQLHADFLDDPSPTDVITFQGDPDEGMAGEICVSVDMAKSYAETHGEDFSKELTLYLVHGWLHLAGFDDLTEKDRQAMKKEEHVCMTNLETNNQIPMFNYRTND